MFKKVRFGDFGKVLIHYASSQMVSNLLRMVSGFLVVHFVEPEGFGFFTGIGVFAGYILFGHGGIINGLGRELPYELGRGNEEHAKELASSVYVLSVYVSAIAAVIFLGFSIYYFAQGNLVHAITFLSYTIIGFLTLFTKQFLPVLYRTNKDFKSLSKQNIRTGIGNLVSIVFVWAFGFWGLCIRGVVLAVYEAALLFKNKPYKLKWNYEPVHFKKLISTGFPIFFAGNINPFVTNVLNNLIFSIGGAVNYGYYALCSIVLSAVGVMPAAFGQVIYPRMAIMYGEGKTVPYILRANRKPLFFQFGVLLFAAIAGAIILPLIIPVLLPKYSPGIAAAQWMLFFPVVQSFNSLLNIFAIMKKMRPFIIANITGGIITLLYCYVMVSIKGFDLVIFPQGLIAGVMVQQIMAFVSLYFILNGSSKQVNLAKENGPLPE